MCVCERERDREREIGSNYIFFVVFDHMLAMNIKQKGNVIRFQDRGNLKRVEK